MKGGGGRGGAMTQFSERQKIPGLPGMQESV